MIIYGEGNKINSSFSLATDYDILMSDNLYYFGDIDPVGFAIFSRLRNTYKAYEIQLAAEYYKDLVRFYSKKECSKIKHEKVESYMEEAIAVIQENDEFSEVEKDFLAKLMVEKRYIPQEAIAII